MRRPSGPQRDPARSRPARRGGTASPRCGSPPPTACCTPKYARLALRFAWRRLLTPAGRRWRTDGMVFLGPRLQLQIGRDGQIRFGRFVWVGHGTRSAATRGIVEIGAKTVIGQECTISAYQRVAIGQQCVIADRAMFIDFDHNVADAERPIRYQGIYKRDVVVGSNVWIGYGAQILRGVTVGDNAIIGASSVVTRDIPANASRPGPRPASSGCAPTPERLPVARPGRARRATARPGPR